MRYCTRCAEAAQPEQAFCRRCGAALGQPEDPAGQPGLSTPEPRRPPTEHRQPPTEHRQPSTEHRDGAADAQESPFSLSQPGQADRHRTVLAVVALAVVLVLGGGALAAWLVLGHATPRTSAGQAGAGHRPPTAGSPPPGVTATAAAGPTTATSHASAGAATAGQGLVRIAPAASQNDSAPQVTVLLRSYFRAINARDYSLYASLFEPSLVLTRAQFRQGYRSTHDSDAILTLLRDSPAGLAATVSFTSHQDPADSATGTSCTAWNVTFYLTPSGSGYLIGKPPAGYHARYRTC